MNTSIQVQNKFQLQLQSEKRTGLYELLIPACGSIIANRFRVDELAAIGRQSFVFRGTDLVTQSPVAIKQAGFDYRRPIQYSRKDVSEMRNIIAQQYKILSSCNTGHMSKPIALFTDEPIIPNAKKLNALSRGEVYLVEEWLSGKTLSDYIFSSWGSLSPFHREIIAARIVFSFCFFWEELAKSGWLYFDMNEQNILVETSGDIRVVDAGSVIPAMEEVVIPSLSPAYTTPRIWSCFEQGKPIAGHLSTMLPILAKLLHFTLTKKTPIQGEIPNVYSSDMSIYSPMCRSALSSMLQLEEKPETVDSACIAIFHWRNSLQ